MKLRKCNRPENLQHCWKHNQQHSKDSNYLKTKYYFQCSLQFEYKARLHFNSSTPPSSSSIVLHNIQYGLAVALVVAAFVKHCLAIAPVGVVLFQHSLAIALVVAVLTRHGFVLSPEVAVLIRYGLGIVPLITSAWLCCHRWGNRGINLGKSDWKMPAAA